MSDYWDDMGIFEDYDGPDNPDYMDDGYDLERELELEREDRFFDRWGYFPNEETEDQRAIRLAQEEQEQILADINYASLEGASISMGELMFKAFTGKEVR